MKTILLILICPVLCFGQSLREYKDFTAQWEGRSNAAYQDSLGYWTVGIGHRVDRDVGVISDAWIDALFEEDIRIAISDAKQAVKTFDSQPHEVKLILVDLSFQLGLPKLLKFEKTIKACNERDYLLMSEELRNSRWYLQVGRRSKHHVDKLKALGETS